MFKMADEQFPLSDSRKMILLLNMKTKGVSNNGQTRYSATYFTFGESSSLRDVTISFKFNVVIFRVDL